MSGSVWSVRIAWKRYPSWSVNDSCAPGCGRSRRTITREPDGPGAEIDAVGELDDLPVLALGVRPDSRAGIQASSGVSRIAARTGSVSS